MKWLKYRLKARALALSPRAYWFTRRLLKGYLEPEITLLPVLCASDRVTLDIGSNWGAYAYYASLCSAHVHCFEPQPRLARVLASGVGRRPNVTVHSVALSNQPGNCEMRVPRNDLGYGTIEASNSFTGKADLSRGVDNFQVETRRLDDLDVARVGFVKVDVEGHEHEVLEGGKALLARDTPAILVETEERHRQGSVSAVTELLGGLGYACYVFTDGKLRPRPDGDPSRNLVFLHSNDQARVLSA
jgi:FkbM family methyltransferase